jgi:hypothetical protein
LSKKDKLKLNSEQTLRNLMLLVLELYLIYFLLDSRCWTFRSISGFNNWYKIGLDHFEMSRKKNYIQICVETKTKMISISFAINRTFFNYWHCEFESRSGVVCSIQHYVIKFVSDLRQVGGFLLVLRFLLPIKLTTTI